MLLGINAKIYRNTNTFAAPTWTVLDITGDLRVAINWAKAQLPTRASKVNKGGKTIADVPLSFTVKQHLTDAGFLAIWAALISNTTLMDLLVLNAANNVDGARGVRGEFNILSADDNQALGEGLKYDLTAEPADSDNAFQTVVVAGGVPVFSTF